VVRLDDLERIARRCAYIRFAWSAIARVAQ
jgi:hypothetical protein